MKKIVFFVLLLMFLTISFLTKAQITVNGSTKTNGNYTSLTNSADSF